MSEDTHMMKKKYRFPPPPEISDDRYYHDKKHVKKNRKLSLLNVICTLGFFAIVGAFFFAYDVSSTKMLEARIESTSDVIERSLIDGFRACHVSSDPVVSLNRRVGTLSLSDQDERIIVLDVVRMFRLCDVQRIFLYKRYFV